MTVHNRCKQTIDCLNHLYMNNEIFDVYLTDDGCTYNTVDMISLHFPKVKIIKGDGNLYWNRGMYKAFEAASLNGYDYYLWLNDDTIVKTNFIKDLLECSHSEFNRSIICGATVSSDNYDEITYSGYTKNKQLSLSDSKQYCDFASGNILLVPKWVFEKVGLLDYRFRHALGDFDYEGRARKLGVKIVQAPYFLGFCNRHATIPRWRDLNIPVNKRIKALYGPLGRNPIEFFVFDNRHNGLIIACFHFLTLHIRCLFPKLWGNRYNEKE